jgi:predicted regulator of Ras-like GTPase activity (Roadblock/LC7/MglB family)
MSSTNLANFLASLNEVFGFTIISGEGVFNDANHLSTDSRVAARRSTALSLVKRSIKPDSTQPYCFSTTMERICM